MHRFPLTRIAATALFFTWLIFLGSDRGMAGGEEHAGNPLRFDEGASGAYQFRMHGTHKSTGVETVDKWRDWEIEFRLDLTCDKRKRDLAILDGTFEIVRCRIIGKDGPLVDYERARFDPAAKPPVHVQAIHAVSGAPIHLIINEAGKVQAVSGLETTLAATFGKLGKKDPLDKEVQRMGKAALTTVTWQEYLGLLLAPCGHDMAAAWQEPLEFASEFVPYPFRGYPLEYIRVAAEAETEGAPRAHQATLLTDPARITGKASPLQKGDSVTGTATMEYDFAAKKISQHQIQIQFKSSLLENPGDTPLNLCEEGSLSLVWKPLPAESK